MPDTVTKRPALPSWLDPRQASVLSPWWQNASRTLAGLAGVNDLASQSMTAVAPMSVLLPEAKTLGQLAARTSRFVASPFPAVDDEIAMPIYRAAKGGTKTVQDVPLSQMVGTQTTLQPSIVTKYGAATSSSALPQVVKSGDVYYIADGHHRLASLVKNGASTAKVEVIEALPNAEAPPYQGWLDRMTAGSGR